ncbi:MAG: hypothetical protein COA78_32625 [Blastopirellula sp.]|nr:MAG: hypothetical protein COA78_32625 [Blastopirellula sp.]
MSRSTPRCSLLVLRSPDIEHAIKFYTTLGLHFTKHSHGKGPEHFASEANGFVFELYPLAKDQLPTTSTRVGFSVPDLDAVIKELKLLGTEVLSEPKQTEWGYRAVVKDLDGHTVELVDSLKT